MAAEIKISTGRSKCRGSTNYVLCGVIPKGQKILAVYVYGAGGGEAAFYCEKHMGPILNSFAKAIKDSKKDIKDL